MNEELPKIILGIERHIAAVRAVQGGFSTSGQSLASVIWELGTMCSLSGKALKDMSVEMERAETHTKAQGHQEMPPSKAREQGAGGAGSRGQGAGGREQQPNLFG